MATIMINGATYNITPVNAKDVKSDHHIHIFYGTRWHKLDRPIQGDILSAEINNQGYEMVQKWKTTEYLGYEPNTLDIHYKGLWYRFKKVTMVSNSITSKPTTNERDHVGAIK